MTIQTNLVTNNVEDPKVSKSVPHTPTRRKSIFDKIKLRNQSNSKNVSSPVPIGNSSPNSSNVVQIESNTPSIINTVFNNLYVVNSLNHCSPTTSVHGNFSSVINEKKDNNNSDDSLIYTNNGKSNDRKNSSHSNKNKKHNKNSEYDVPISLSKSEDICSKKTHNDIILHHDHTLSLNSINNYHYSYKTKHYGSNNNIGNLANNRKKHTSSPREREKESYIEQMYQMQHSMKILGDMLRNQDCEIENCKRDKQKLIDEVNKLADENTDLRSKLSECRRARNVVWQELEFYKLATRTRRDKIISLTQQIAELNNQKNELTKHTEQLLEQLGFERSKSRKLSVKIKDFGDTHSKIIHVSREHTRSLSNLNKCHRYQSSMPEINHTFEAFDIENDDIICAGNQNKNSDNILDFDTHNFENSQETFCDLQDLELETLRMLEKLEQETHKLLGETEALTQRTSKRMKQHLKNNSMSLPIINKPKSATEFNNFDKNVKDDVIETKSKIKKTIQNVPDDKHTAQAEIVIRKKEENTNNDGSDETLESEDIGTTKNKHLISSNNILWTAESTTIVKTLNANSTIMLENNKKHPYETEKGTNNGEIDERINDQNTDKKTIETSDRIENKAKQVSSVMDNCSNKLSLQNSQTRLGFDSNDVQVVNNIANENDNENDIKMKELEANNKREFETTTMLDHNEKEKQHLIKQEETKYRPPTPALSHHTSDVKMYTAHDDDDNGIDLLKKANAPMFLLLSAFEKRMQEENDDEDNNGCEENHCSQTNNNLFNEQEKKSSLFDGFKGWDKENCEENGKCLDSLWDE